MSGKAGFSPGSNSGRDADGHGPALLEGVTTALSWLTVVPVRGATVFDRTTGRRAIAALPVAGLVPGVAGALMAAIVLAGAGPGPVPAVAALLAGCVTTVAQIALTRALHLDGAADVADALGSYGDQQRAQEVLADSMIGPTGVGAIVLALMVQVTGNAALIGSGWPAWRVAVAVCLIPVLARAAAMTSCHRAFPPMREGGFGGLVAGTQRTRSLVVWWLALVVIMVPVAGVAGPVACAASAAVAVVLARHSTRRFGGVNGDVLGAVIEAAGCLSLVVVGFAAAL